MVDFDDIVKSLFEAKAQNLIETMKSYGGLVGFKIPDYQRTYDWKEENIERLVEDCWYGFNSLSISRENDRIPNTFLGTLILVKEQSPSDEKFDGTSLEIVDGQQRLTTLVLMCCALYGKIRQLWNTDIYAYDSYTVEFTEWLADEKDFLLKQQLRKTILGMIDGREGFVFFPRIVRSEDSRASDERHRDMNSNIGVFLMKFEEFERDLGGKYKTAQFDPHELETMPPSENMQLYKKYKYLLEFIEQLARNQGEEIKHVDKNNFQKRQFRQFFRRLPDKQTTVNQFFSHIAESEKLEEFFRLLLFSHYVLNCTVLARVETKYEDLAFDIFDALNTTGEPLTALETLKPSVVKFENTEGTGYIKSESKTEFDRIEKFLNKKYQSTDTRQKETKEMLVSFALYLTGKKIGLKLIEQRQYLRNEYGHIAKKDRQSKRMFIEVLADITQFRYEFWAQKGSKGDIPLICEDRKDNLRLCIAILRDMRTSLVIPALARYWVRYKNHRTDENEESFFEAVKALTAFVLIRRAMTGGTDGIDNELREIMFGTENTTGLKIGSDFSGQILDVDVLREILWSNLSAKTKKMSGSNLKRESWVSLARNTPMYKTSQPLCRFLLLAAAHRSRPDSKIPGLMSRHGVRRDEDFDRLTYQSWSRETYQTIEHIAPQTYSNGWSEKIYADGGSTHRIGNLTLLPKSENSRVRDAEWGRKRCYYKVFTSKTEVELDERIQESASAGFPITDAARQSISKNVRLGILESIVEVENWNLQMIEERSKNTLELAWDILSKWLKP